jgi:hypothetical protein
MDLQSRAPPEAYGGGPAIYGMRRRIRRCIISLLLVRAIQFPPIHLTHRQQE